MTVTLKGMTWSHPRGYDPMVATSTIWRERTGVEIAWDQRSLQDFESFPVEELARQYDFIVIDHPHVGQVTAEQCLLPLDVPGHEAELAAIAAGSVGPSFRSYNWQGRQWAFPIDAASQVMAYRADLLPEPPRRWEDVMALALGGRVTLPLRPPHSLMMVFTLAANLGHPIAGRRGAPFLGPEIGTPVIGMLAELAALLDPEDFSRDPIAASELLAGDDGGHAVMPYGYGYVNYAMAGFRPNRLTFADVPAAGTLGPAGTALGGTGIAISAFSANPPAAIEYAYWVASAAVQRGPYAAAGGQPGHLAAWTDDEVNAATGDFYRNTLRTLETAYLRPRHNGYMGFQAGASERLNAGLLAHEDPASIVAALNALYAESF
ncbi:MAG: extracellular solute-binding protein [Devosia sp.]|nr:extracellular solute-binding protein [Devosia sp.]